MSIGIFAVGRLQDKCNKLEEKLKSSESNHADKVEKSLIKNLVIGYISAPNNDKPQILKLISKVLQFDQAESDRVGLNKGGSSWLGGLLHSTSGSGQSGMKT